MFSMGQGIFTLEQMAAANGVAPEALYGDSDEAQKVYDQFIKLDGLPEVPPNTDNALYLTDEPPWRGCGVWLLS